MYEYLLFCLSLCFCGFECKSLMFSFLGMFMCVVYIYGGVCWVGYWVIGCEEGSDEVYCIELLRVLVLYDCLLFFFWMLLDI